MAEDFDPREHGIHPRLEWQRDRIAALEARAEKLEVALNAMAEKADALEADVSRLRAERDLARKLPPEGAEPPGYGWDPVPETTPSGKCQAKCRLCGEVTPHSGPYWKYHATRCWRQRAEQSQAREAALRGALEGIRDCRRMMCSACTRIARAALAEPADRPCVADAPQPHTTCPELRRCLDALLPEGPDLVQRVTQRMLDMREKGVDPATTDEPLLPPQDEREIRDIFEPQPGRCGGTRVLRYRRDKATKRERPCPGCHDCEPQPACSHERRASSGECEQCGYTEDRVRDEPEPRSTAFMERLVREARDLPDLSTDEPTPARCGGTRCIGTFQHINPSTGEHEGDEDIPCPGCPDCPPARCATCGGEG